MDIKEMKDDFESGGDQDAFKWQQRCKYLIKRLEGAERCMKLSDANWMSPTSNWKFETDNYFKKWGTRNG